MIKLQLSKNKTAKVDDVDYTNLSKWKWSYHNMGYAVRNDKGKLILMHRQIMGFPKKGIDHINGDKTDNRRSNLRICSQLSNSKNSSAHKDSTSKYKGVNRHLDGVWRSRIMNNGIIYDLGLFKDERSAAIAYNKAAVKYHSEFARLNVI